MTPEEFESAWTVTGDRLIRFPRESISKRRFSPDAERFLTVIGLPEEAAPFLNFGSKRLIDLPTAASLFRQDDSGDEYPTIGFNGSGDPICVDEDTASRVIYVNHDNNFSINFINSSVPQLAYGLLAFREAVRAKNELKKKGALPEGRFPVVVVDRFITRMEEIDAKAITPGSFWLMNISSNA